MIERGNGGVIVNLASTAAHFGSGAYSASKWAVRGITSGMARELGPHGIRVVAIGPTVTETPGMAATREKYDDAVEQVIAGIPLGRSASPDDIARTALFLASDAASLISGVTLLVDGGQMSR
jgi:NAD(P)-dependent dehydrogenase (short-subunit alcohol dehydrogenase family)